MTAKHPATEAAHTSGLPWPTFIGAGVLVLAAVLAYASSFQGAFVFDDIAAIEDNTTIRQLWPPWQVLSPPSQGETVSGRPLLNVTLAINYALHGTKVWGYHLVNLAIHILNTLLLYGILKRTFVLPQFANVSIGASTGLAVAIALLWGLHPLQTESVTYIVQRAESLVGFFYLLTLYCVIRGAASDRSVRWHTGAVCACLLGMAAKEVMVTAPLIVLLYDRTFLTGSFRAALRYRRHLYVALFMTWGVLFYLVVSTALIFQADDLSAASPWSYALSQPGVILHYLRLSFWPHPLCLDYGWPVARTWGDMLPGMLVVGAILGAVVGGLIRKTVWSFPGVWFFLILGPTSSVLPISQLAVEHRMYLPLAAVITVAVFSGYAACQRLVQRRIISKIAARRLGLCLVVVVASALGYLTFQRNLDYESELSIWQDTVSKAPHNHRPHNNLGLALFNRGRTEAAIGHYRQALRIKPDYLEAHINLANLMARTGRVGQARDHYLAAVRLKPDYAPLQNHLGIALFKSGEPDRARIHFREAVRLVPEFVNARINLGNTLILSGRLEQAIKQYRIVLRLNPDATAARYYLGVARLLAGEPELAASHFQAVFARDPHFTADRTRWGTTLTVSHTVAEKIETFRRIQDGAAADGP